VLSLAAGRSVIDPDPNLVSPGILGFLAFFFLAIALYFLVRSMNGRLRRMNFRAAEIEAAQAAEAARRGEAGEPPAGTVDESGTERGRASGRERGTEAGTGPGTAGR
jgi:hypothetical protein